MADKSSWVAKTGLVFAVVGIILTIVQWLYGLKQNRINTAIELSKIYLVDKEIAQRFATLLDEAPEEIQGNYDKFLKARSYIDFLEYVAYLANRERIDNEFVAHRIKCDIAHIPMIEPKGPASLFVRINEIKSYVREGRHVGCRPACHNQTETLPDNDGAACARIDRVSGMSRPSPAWPLD